MLAHKRTESLVDKASYAWLFLIFILFSQHSHAKEEQVHLGVLLTSSAQRDVLSEIASSFHAESGIRVAIHAGFDEEYKKFISQWMSSETPPDIVMWQAGERLLKYVKKNLVLPISDLWSNENWDSQYSHAIKESISFRNIIYGLPYTYYTWGLYYKESLFSKHKLLPPRTWPELLQFCTTVNKKGLTPFTAGIKNAWPAAAWFDYINLRLNGLPFHKQLTQGYVPYTDERVINIFRHWKELIDHKCFATNAHTMDWKQAIPLLYYNNAAMMLMGNFIVGQFSAPLKRDFKFAPFPKITENMPQYEDAPTDIFFIPKKAKSIDAAKKLLVYLAKPEVVAKFSSVAGMLSTNLRSDTSVDYFTLAHLSLLKRADGVAQFYDRDVPPAMDKLATPILAEFMMSGDIEHTIERLEKARNVAYTQ